MLEASKIRVSPDEKWVRSSCPLASYTHPKGSDSNPSFGVKVNDRGESGYNCFTCGSGSLKDLIHRMTWTIGIRNVALDFFLLREIFEDEAVGDSLSFVDKFKSIHKKVIEVPRPVPSEILEIFPLFTNREAEVGHLLEWLDHRGISQGVASKYGLRVNYGGTQVHFPLTDTDGEVYELHGLSLYDKFFYYVTPEVAGYPFYSWGRKDGWFGMQHYDSTKEVILVESETDVLRLATLGVSNVLACCGPLNNQKLRRITSTQIVLAFDSDEGGLKCEKKARKYFRDRVLHKINFESIGINDAGDLLNVEDWELLYDNREPLTSTLVKPTSLAVPKYKDKFKVATT
jgi:5S rRNA maturation endonuclease (ribonuclease M5)